MSIIKSFSVGNGDMFFIDHNTDNFSMIDCCISDHNKSYILSELRSRIANKGIVRFISTHPDQDHIQGLEHLDDSLGIVNFYVAKNEATKIDETPSFKRYCMLRDGEHAYYLYKGCSRRWMNEEGEGRGPSGIFVLWPDVENQYYKDALADAKEGIAFNNMSIIIRYRAGGVSIMWLGDLETGFMKSIERSVNLVQTDIVFAPHHGRKSGKIPNSWLEKIRPKIIVIGEARSRHINYYTGYDKITQNRAGEITMECVGKKVHVYASNENYGMREWLFNEKQPAFAGYIGTLRL